MVFSSATFLLLFLPIAFVGNLIATKRFSNIFLLIASLVFYAWGEPFYVLLMLASILVNWFVGNLIGRFKGRKRKIALAAGVIFDLGILGSFKYAGFFAALFNDLFGYEIVPVPNIVLPIGISFFIFQAISYIADVYKKEVEASSSIINVALYISFFPQLIAGPIVKYRDINKQIVSRSITVDGVSAGFKRFIYGLAKKVLIANILGQCVDTVYGFDINQLDSTAAWVCAIAYTFQIYYDFSGYSDMAIGLGRMFGFRIPENFNYPYLSKSITEFWRRWHISLGTWFREYVYIPLGGNRSGKVRTYVNLVIVFFLTGLWHGADLSFVFWGLYHGFFMIIERLGFGKILDKIKILSVIYCFFIVNIGWVLFRAEDTASGLNYIARLLMPLNYTEAAIPSWYYMDAKTILVGILAIVGMGWLTFVIPKRIRNMWRDSVVEAVFCVALLVLSIASIASDTYNPFIYFQF